MPREASWLASASGDNPANSFDERDVKVGTPHRTASALADSLLPSAFMFAGVGPTKTRPAVSTSSANSAFSDRKP